LGRSKKQVKFIKSMRGQLARWKEVERGRKEIRGKNGGGEYD
jgi:hypothetical protein